MSATLQQFEVEPEMVRLDYLPATSAQNGSYLRLDWVFGTFVEMCLSTLRD